MPSTVDEPSVSATGAGELLRDEDNDYDADGTTLYWHATWPTGHLVWRSYEGMWIRSEQKSVSAPWGFGSLVLASANKPAHNRTVIVDHAGTIYTRRKAGGFVATEPGLYLCSKVSSWRVDRIRVAGPNERFGCELDNFYGARVFDDMANVLSWHALCPIGAWSKMKTLPMPVGSIIADGRDEMVCYFAYDLIHHCATLRRAGASARRRRDARRGPGPGVFLGEGG